MFKNPTLKDSIILILFTILILFNPYFMDGTINVFETGLYLPYINSVLKGAVPFKDFVPLRGPFEIYMPAMMMKIFGAHLNILYQYFYLGNLLCVILCVLIAKQLFKSRLIFYLFVPVMVGRTFPRVVYTFWGGMRFAYGLLALLFLIYFLKKGRKKHLFISGLFSSAAFFTSIDIGLCAILTVLGLFASKFLFFKDCKTIFKNFIYYPVGCLTVFLPYSLYLVLNNAWAPFINSTYNIVFAMTKMMPDFLVENQPSNFIEAVSGLNPFSPYFKFLTPGYCYIFAAIYILIRLKNKNFNKSDLPFLSVFFYGLIIYVFAFRKIGTSYFEMALQPEKILLFFMVELAFLKLIALKKVIVTRKGVKLFLINFFLFGVVASSIIYPIRRFNKRYFTGRYLKAKILNKDTAYLHPLHNRESKALEIKRASGIKIDATQAKDIEMITRFIKENTFTDEPVFMLPELGFYSFITDRPFVGRFPMVTFSWFGGGWHEELFADLKETNPRFAILIKELPSSFEKFYFRVEKNRKNYDEIDNYIRTNYSIVGETPSFLIYKKN